MEHSKITDSLKTRIPLFKKEWTELYVKMKEHPHAPGWNTECGDRLTEDDMLFVRNYADSLYSRRDSFSQLPPDWLIEWTEKMKQRTLWFKDKITSETLKESWQSIIPMTRNDMQSRLELIVPEDALLDRLVVNPTSGTTGHPIPAPNHPGSVGCYDPLIQYALRRHGVNPVYSNDRAAAIQICSQKKTITYCTVHSYLEGAGFAKINLSPENWKMAESADIYINEMRPVFLSGDPFSFMEYMRMGLTYRPEAVLTTALTLSGTLRAEMEEYFACPVVDMYSLNETGPVAYSCPSDPSQFHILPHDLFAEILDPDGKQVPEGTAGRIALSGGRNPYLPLLRYITGDTASISYGKCVCGEKTPLLKGLHGREMVLFRTPSGKIINSIDIAGIIRKYPVYFFQFTQRKDYSCCLEIAAGNDLTLKKENELMTGIEMLFSGESKIFISRKLRPGEGKNIPFISELN